MKMVHRVRGRSPGEARAGAAGIPHNRASYMHCGNFCPAGSYPCARLVFWLRTGETWWAQQISGSNARPGLLCGGARPPHATHVLFVLSQTMCMEERFVRVIFGADREVGSGGSRAADHGGAERGSAVLAWMAVVFHLCAFASVFDIYFRSPIVNGMAEVEQPLGHAAKRVVIIVADGGRADTVFDGTDRVESISKGGPLAAHIRSKILAGEASWGVSHTRVPTESRPCHASLLGGIYEDPSAVMKGWQQNPVEFDSVINGSSSAFCYGSPDVVPLFAKGLAHVTAGMYPPDWEDFTSGCGSPERGCRRLDDWVFAQVEELLANASSDASLRARLHGDRVVLFLHLLGLDMNGHAHRPNSRQYFENVASVDEGVARLERLLARFYNDSRTAFVLTADHGMSNKGSHGDGEPECTRTPLVVWGAGVRASPRSDAGSGATHAAGHGGLQGDDASPVEWGDLRWIERKDIRCISRSLSLSPSLSLSSPLCVRACVHTACVRARACACVRTCMRAYVCVAGMEISPMG